MARVEHAWPITLRGADHSGIACHRNSGAKIRYHPDTSDQFLLLHPTPAAVDEHVGRAIIAILTLGADHDRAALNDDRIAKRIACFFVRGFQFDRGRPDHATSSEHISAAWISENLGIVQGRPDGRNIAIQGYRAAKISSIRRQNQLRLLGRGSARVRARRSPGWLAEQQARLKQSQIEAVEEVLRSYRESPEVADKAAPVRGCYRYLVDRPGQFDYQSAIEADLPIGSGEVESAHRYVIQHRRKFPGAWWNKEVAADMLALRTRRANGQWECYWPPSSTSHASEVQQPLRALRRAPVATPADTSCDRASTG